MYFDRFDICAAYNLFSQYYGWDAYTCGVQARLAKIKFRPSHSEEFLSGLSDNAKEIYASLVRKHAPSRTSTNKLDF